MVRGRTVIIVMFVIGAGLLGGYDLVRRSATPRDAQLVEDRGADTGTFDRVYSFAGDRYRIAAVDGEEGAPPSLLVERLDGPSTSVPLPGAIDSAHLLELEKGLAPTVVVAFRGEGNVPAPPVMAFREEDGAWTARPLEPLPEELAKRALGGDVYERQGAFLYRKVRIEAQDSTLPPIVVKLFYDFTNEAWKITN